MKVLPVHVEEEARQGDLKTPDVSCNWRGHGRQGMQQAVTCMHSNTRRETVI